MNKIIKEQLGKCAVASIPEYSDDDLTLTVSRYTETTRLDFQENKTYLIELEDYLIHPGDTFTLHKEWNNGVIPKSKFLKARVIRMHGRMIQFDAFDTNYEGDAEGDHYSDLWLPLKSIHLRRIIN